MQLQWIHVKYISRNKFVIIHLQYLVITFQLKNYVKYIFFTKDEGKHSGNLSAVIRHDFKKIRDLCSIAYRIVSFLSL